MIYNLIGGLNAYYFFYVEFLKVYYTNFKYDSDLHAVYPILNNYIHLQLFTRYLTQ